MHACKCVFQFTDPKLNDFRQKKRVAVCPCILDVTAKLTQDTGGTQICQFNSKIRVYIQRQQKSHFSWSRINIPKVLSGSELVPCPQNTDLRYGSDKTCKNLKKVHTSANYHTH